MTELKRFTEKWCRPDYPPEAVRKEDLATAEAEFGVSLPHDYRNQILAIGLPSPTLALLSAIADMELELHDLSSLCNPSQIIEETHGWQAAGLPCGLLVIGNDSMGNKFCFNLSDLTNGSESQAPIFFWDHDFNSTEKIATCFSDWIEGYLGRWGSSLTYTDF